MVRRAVRSGEKIAPTHTASIAPPLSAFVGRKKELAVLGQLFDEGARLVTVVGPPGMGKTRLLLRFPETPAARRFATEGGVWFCDLSEAYGRADACRVLARTLGFRLPTDLEVDALVDYVGDVLAERGPTLLLCDNFEQMDEPSATALDRWCRAAPAAAILVSSRRRLLVSGEIVVELEPLALPALHASDPELAGASDAALLFLDRARAAGHAPSNLDLVAVDELVRELDGLPLAIELAAARSRVTSPRELLERLAKSHDVLSPATPIGPHALRSLRTAVARSWELLQAHEQSALAQCAFFAGDFSLEAAEQVVDLAAFPDAPPVIDVLASLLDQSLVTQRRTSEGTRFRMYVSLRDFARGRLRADFDLAGVAARHRRWFVDGMVPLAEAFWRTGDAAVLARLEADRENLLLVARALLPEASEPGRSTRAAWRDFTRIVFCLEPAYAIAGDGAELLVLLDVAIAAAARTGDDSLRARLLVASGDAHGVRGDNARALADLGAAVKLADELSENAVAAEALMLTGVRERQQGRVEDALETVSRARILAGEGQWPRTEGACALVMGMVLGELGRVDESRQANLGARAIFFAARDQWSEALAVCNLAQLDQAAGDLAAAERGFDAALAVFRSLGDGRYEARYLGYRAALDFELGKLDAARALFRRSIARMQGLRTAHTEALWRAALGALEATAEDIPAAEDALGRADAIASSVDAPMFRSAIDLHRGHLDLASARAAFAARDSARAEALVASARARLARATHVERSEDVRFAVRMLTRALTHAPGVAAGTPEELIVGAGTSSFRVSGGPTVSLERRGALRRILHFLVEHRLHAPGVASDWQVLLEHGWPGERVLAEAGATRVRVAVATLRKLGLAPVLVTRDDGYLLSERSVVRRMEL